MTDLDRSTYDAPAAGDRCHVGSEFVYVIDQVLSGKVYYTMMRREKDGKMKQYDTGKSDLKFFLEFVKSKGTKIER
ncbi:MAG TPA: hypothetical protein VNH18_20765 [Bryobacteraceae bacterium]|nr:hypothetical protein [Bryobacteraceae bacterium]